MSDAAAGARRPPRRRGEDAREGSGILLARAGLFAILVAVLMWPVAWNGGPLGFPDTEAYYEQGGQALDRIAEELLPAPDEPAGAEGGAPAGAAEQERRPVYTIRSVPFSAMVNSTMRLLGEVGPVIVLSGLTAWLILLACRDLAPGRAAIAGLAAAGLTTAPFYASQIMADVMAGWLVLIPALLAWRRWGRWTAAAMLAVAFVAIASHYSHVPLGLVVMPALGLALVLQRRWGLALMAQVPLILALSLNIAVGKAATGGISIAPARLPILLARTFEDGPGRAYLAEACPEAGWTLCEVYRDGVPERSGQVLWGPRSIGAVATPEQRRAVSREEIPFVLAVLRDRPLEQGAAFARNVGRQLVSLGLDDVNRTEIEIRGHRDLAVELQRLEGDAEVRAIEWVQWGAVGAGLVGLVLALARGGPGVRPAAFLLLLGLGTNAAVCGGLSIPTDRYQGRVIWTLVLLGLALALRPPAPRERAGWVADRRGRMVRPGARGGPPRRGA